MSRLSKDHPLSQLYDRWIAHKKSQGWDDASYEVWQFLEWADEHEEIKVLTPGGEPSGSRLNV